MSKIYLEILDKERREILEKLKEFSSLGYLAGGTALALQLCHRISLDFDFFIKKPMSRRILKKSKEVFGEKIEVVRETGDQITIITPQKIKVDFIYYWYPLISSLVETPWVNFASIFDIAADKAVSLGRRATWRDYVDIFFLLKREKVSLEKIISLAKEKFKGEFNEALFLEQLVYFKDLEMTKIEFLQEKHQEGEIKKFLENEVWRYLKFGFFPPKAGVKGGDKDEV